MSTTDHPDQERKNRRGLRWWAWLIIGLVVVLASGGGFFWVQHTRVVELGEVTPVSDTVLGTGTVTISSALPGYLPGRGEVTILVDGLPLPAEDLVLAPDRVEATVSLADGPYTVELEYTSNNVFSRYLSRSWSFTVDTTPPTITLLSPAMTEILQERLTHVKVDLDEPATLELLVDGAPLLLDPADVPALSFAAQLELSEGERHFLLRAVDAVGNSSSLEWTAWLDYDAPVILAQDWPDEPEPWTITSVTGSFAVTDAFPENLIVTATLNEEPVELEEGPVASGSTRAYSLETGELPEGRHVVALTATDRAGHTSTWQSEFLIDSSSSFGTRTMAAGAVGNDVKQLQALLKRKGFYTGGTSGIYDEATAEAVAGYNAAHGLTGSVVAQETLELLRGSIRIDLSERKLYHYTDGKLRKTYSIAVGQAQYPTPTGSFEIISKAVDPTWTPPNSEWARGMEPVPPGPGNPLGTRWMGINSPSVGIHGTYSSSSIGTAASHGCIRMHLREAEELFDLVYIGTPVQIVP